MNKILNDAWFIGVAGSLIASTIFLLISKFISSLTHKKRINIANELVVNQLRSYMVNSEFIRRDTEMTEGSNDIENIIFALKRSAARKYQLREDELFSVSEYMEELTTEIIGNTYLSTGDQLLYFKYIEQYLSREVKKKKNTNLNLEDIVIMLFSLILICIFAFSFVELLRLLFQLFETLLLQYDFPIEEIPSKKEFLGALMLGGIFIALLSSLSGLLSNYIKKTIENITKKKKESDKNKLNE